MLLPGEKSIVLAKNIGFILPSGEILFDGLELSINRGDKIALIGKNGVGKSTLMKVLAGVILPTSGTVELPSTSYVDQLDEGVGERGDFSILDLLNSAHEDWWQLQVHYEKLFGQPLPDLEKNLKQLSGGEYMRLKLAIATFNRPDILLLDEPTNHLDLSAREILQKFINDFPGGVMIISHDIHFIDQFAHEVWELENQKITRFGGNYQDYLKQKAQKDESKQKRLTEALKEVDKKEWAIIREEKRAVKSKRHGTSLAGNRSMSSAEKGFFKDKATAAEGRKKESLNFALDRAKQDVEANAMSKKKTAKLDLYEGENERGRTLLTVQDGILTVDGNVLVQNIDFEIKFGEKILLTGDNGTGKTSLLKAFLGISTDGVELSGRHIFRIPKLLGMYISQRYDQIDKNKSLLENMYAANSKLDIQVARRALGNLLFKEKHEVDKSAGSLSGGETVRLAFAMASVSPSDLLVLDEPTNNLDVETIKVIVEALNHFSGAVLVVSHDLNFLKQIGIDKTFKIEDGKFIPINDWQ